MMSFNRLMHKVNTLKPKKISKNDLQSRLGQTASASRKRKLIAPRTEAQYAAKPEKFKETYDRVISAVAKMRTEKVSLA